MKNIIVIVFCFSFTLNYAQEQYSKSKAWEKAIYSVQHEGKQLMRIEVAFGQTEVQNDTWNKLFNALVIQNKKMIVDASLSNSHLMRVYFIDSVAIELIKKNIPTYYTDTFILNDPIEIQIHSQEFIEISGLW